MSFMLETYPHAAELSMDFSQSLAKRRLRPSHVNVRSTTQRRGSTSNPSAVSDRRMISMVQPPQPFNMSLSF